MGEPSDPVRIVKPDLDPYLDGHCLAIKTIPVHEWAVHTGMGYFIKQVVSVAGGALTVMYFTFKTPTVTEIHAQALFGGASGEFTIELSEDCTLSNDGNPITGRNMNRNYPDTPELHAYVNPSVTTQGTILWTGKVGVGKEAGVSLGMNYEIIARKNTQYLFKLIKVSPTNPEWIEVDFPWTEKPEG